MAKQNKTSNIGKPTNQTTKANREWKFPLERRNVYFILAGVATIMLGYILMTLGVTEDAAVIDGKWNNTLSVSVAPVILLIGYCILIPMGIMKDFSKKTDNTDNSKA